MSVTLKRVGRIRSWSSPRNASIPSQPPGPKIRILEVSGSVWLMLPRVHSMGVGWSLAVTIWGTMAGYELAPVADFFNQCGKSEREHHPDANHGWMQAIGDSHHGYLMCFCFVYTCLWVQGCSMTLTLKKHLRNTGPGNHEIMGDACHTTNFSSSSSLVMYHQIRVEENSWISKDFETWGALICCCFNSVIPRSGGLQPRAFLPSSWGVRHCDSHVWYQS